MDGGILMETLNRPAVYKDKTAYMKQPECKLFLLRPFSTWGGLAFLLLQALTTFLQDMEMVAQLYCLCFHISNIPISFSYARNLGWGLGSKDAKLCYRF